MDSIADVQNEVQKELDATRLQVQKELMLKNNVKTSSKETLIKFEEQSKKEFAQSSKEIFSIINKFSHNLNKRLTIVWLKHKIYQLLNFQKPIDVAKREIISDEINNFNFDSPQSTIEQFINACHKTIGIDVDQYKIASLRQTLVTGKKKQIQELFPNPPPIYQKLNKIIEERLNDFIHDYKCFPENSLEKVFQREMIIAFINKYYGAKELSCMNQITQLKNEASNIKVLRDVYLNEFNFLRTDVQDIFERLILENGSKIYQNLCTLKSKIFTIDILQLERLIYKTNNTQKLISDKDVILIVGENGSDKAASILKFLGYNLEAKTVNGISVLVPVELLKKDHSSFEANFCTGYINAASIPDKMYKIGMHPNKRTFVICDSPNLDDSLGVEVDIANGVGMINALHKARSVRVVVILNYDSLIADKMAGAIKMSEIISNLFHELTVMESIAIYFNKVPANKIAEVPAMIEYKLTHLSSIQKSNSKLTMFLEEILERSREEENFIDPLEGDFKALFNTLVRMPAITHVMENFQYDFTQSTKREIEKFAQSERSKVREYFIDKKFKNAQFHLRMLQKLMNILHNNDKIQGYYNQLAEFIQEESEKELTYYEELVMQIINCKESYNLKDRLKDSKDKIAELQILFSDFEKLKVVSSDKVSQIIQDNKNRLLNQFNNLSEVTSETILAAKSFSLLLDKDLEGKIIKIIERRFNDVYGEAEQQARHKSYDEMEDNLKILVNLVGFNSQLSQKSALNNLASRLRDLKGMLNQEVDTGFTDISDNITKGQARLTRNTVNEVNKKIQRIKTIQALKFLDNNTEVRTKLNNELKAIENKCKKIIRQLQNLKLSLNEEVQAKNSIEKDQLINKKIQIQFLMRIENIGENLTDDYQYAKQNIQRKLKENVEILKTWIVALKGKKNDEIYKNLQNIKKATIVVVQCSEIVEYSDSLDLAQSIETEFIQFLNGEIMAMRSIQIKLNQINNDSFVKIRLHHNKIESYSKMGMIGYQVESSVEQLRNELSEMLKAPFLEFKQRVIPYLEQKKHYKYLPYSIEKFEKLSLFVLEIEEILTPDEYRKISQCVIQIEESLINLYKTMQLDIETFIDLEFEHGKYPNFLKDLIKTLLAISLKTKSCEYLTRKLNFEVNEKLTNIQAKLDELKDKMENLFGESHINVEEIQALLVDFKFYSEIEDVYKAKGEADKFGFRDLLRRCRDELHNLKSGQALIQEMPKNTNNFLKNEHQGYGILKSAELNSIQQPKGDFMKKFYVQQQKIITDIEKFLKIQYKCGQNPTYLKDLMKILFIISQKSNSRQYLQGILNFDVLANLKGIEIHLGKLMNDMQHLLDKSNFKVKDIYVILADIKFYGEVQDLFTAEANINSIGFREQQRKCQNLLNSIYKNNENLIIRLIEGYQPSKISWSQIKSIYDSYNQLQIPDGKRIRRIITQQLKQLQANVLRELKIFSRSIGNDPELIVANTEKMNEFLKLFKEADQIYKNMRLIYNEEDKKIMQINNRFLCEVGLNVIDAFKEQFVSIKKQIIDRNFIKLKQKINNFGTLQCIVQNVFIQKNQDLNKEQMYKIQGLSYFIKSKQESLLIVIKDHPLIEQHEKKYISTNKDANLKSLLEILHRIYSQVIQQKKIEYHSQII